MTIHPSHIHLDMRVEATGVHSAGTTTWTTPVPFYGTHAVVLATGEMIALTPALNLNGAITGISATNPATISSAGHGLVSGTVVLIEGSDSDPPVDGEHPITVLTADTFSIPVDLSGGASGSSGTWSATDRTEFTAEGNFAGAAVLGTPYAMEVEIARPIPRGQDGMPMHTERFLLKRLTVAFNEPSGFIVKFGLPAPYTDRTITRAADFDAPSERLYRFLTTVGHKAESTRIMFNNNDWQPCRIHTYEIAAEVQGGLR